MKKIILILILPFFYISCEKDIHVYNNSNRVYFDKKELHYTFGDKPLNLQKYSLDVRVNLLGAPPKNDKKFVINIVDTATTANVGKHYTKFKQDAVIKKDSSYALIPIELLRENLEDSVFHITLKVVATNELDAGVQESLVMKISFDNILPKPRWWDGQRDYLGDFHPKKYQKFIEYNGGKVLSPKYDGFKAGGKYYENLAIFKKVKDFFEKNPDSQVKFPDSVWPL